MGVSSEILNETLENEEEGIIIVDIDRDTIKLPPEVKSLPELPSSLSKNLINILKNLCPKPECIYKIYL